MKYFKNFLFGLVLFAFICSTNSCQQAGGNKTGSEFIPDMAHSVAYEANVYNYYSLNTFDSASVKSLRELSQPGKPVAGTMPRGYASAATTGQTFASPADAVEFTKEKMKLEDIPMTPNGHVPYYFPDSDSGRAAATAELIYNPFPITKAGIAQGQELYTLFCAICHGDKGDGLGYLFNPDENPNAKYPVAPKSFIIDEMVDASNGRYYHSIMYGINMMGNYADKLSYEERWQVIHYIRSLQAKEKKLKYSETENTLNPDFGVPGSPAADAAAPTEPAATDTAEPAEDATSTDEG
jgi:mono/diheme cytochrome c family protein